MGYAVVGIHGTVVHFVSDIVTCNLAQQSRLGKMRIPFFFGRPTVGPLLGAFLVVNISMLFCKVDGKRPD
jgi:hypothetical protein